MFVEFPGTNLKLSELERVAHLHQLGEMAAGLAHELNQPLAVIMYTLSGAVRRARAGELDNAQMLDVLQATVAHTRRVADIVARVRKLVAQQPTDKTCVCLNKVVREMLELPRFASGGQQVRVVEELAPILPPVLGDAVQLEQVILNLLSNAIHAASQTQEREGRVLVRTASDTAVVELSVWDNGPGLSPAARRRMFEPFFTTKPEGFGLGLTICQTIIEDHNGRIWAEPAPEGGLRLCMRLPITTMDSP